MTSLYVILSIVVASCILIGMLWKAAMVLWRVAGGAHEFAEAVRDNTKATNDVAEELRTFAGDVTSKLAELSERVTRLEGHL